MNVYNNPNESKWSSLLKRPSQSYRELEPLVQEVFQEVKSRGDAALISYTERFDKVALKEIFVSEKELSVAESQVPQALQEAIQNAKTNIENFHKAQQTPPVHVETQEGVNCWQEKKPIASVGFYIPGGTAPLFSTILMLAIPARITGCDKIVLCTPPQKDGQLPAVVLYTAQLCGISKIYKIGGIQAIAAMTFGTESIPKVSKIFGPGNQYVTAAKQIALQYGVAIDMPAGPSELLVVADETAVPEFVAADLLSQAEHGTDSQVILITTFKPMINQVQLALQEQLSVLPRKAIAEKALQNARFIYFEKESDALDFINNYAPEHLSICMKNEAYFLKHLQNAGSVFLGNYTPESAGDYASGTNHTLPTNGYARQYSGVNLDSFLKAVSFQKITEIGIKALGATVSLMAAAEGLEGHRNAVTKRLESIAKDEKKNI